MSGAPGEVVEEFPIEILEIERTFYNVALPKDVSEVSRMIELKPRPLCHWNNLSHNISAWQVSQSLPAEAAVGTLWKHRREATAKPTTLEACVNTWCNNTMPNTAMPKTETLVSHETRTFLGGGGAGGGGAGGGGAGARAGARAGTAGVQGFRRRRRSAHV